MRAPAQAEAPVSNRKPKRFYQRSIRRFRAYVDQADGRKYIAGAHLPCGHYQPCKRKRPAPQVSD